VVDCDQRDLAIALDGHERRCGSQGSEESKVAGRADVIGNALVAVAADRQDAAPMLSSSPHARCDRALASTLYYMNGAVGTRRPHPAAQPDDENERAMTAESVVAGGHRLEYAWYGDTRAGAPPIVMLHEGLGSISLWKDFPQQLADATHRRVLAYSRYGCGGSDPLTGPRTVEFMHIEALQALPDLLGRLGVREAVLFGHSEGGSMALIHAARSKRPVEAVIVMAPHVIVEPYGLRSIAQARREYLDTDLRERLARHHADVESAFWGWNDIWLRPEFAAWNIEALLPDITCPVLAMLGTEDQYGTMDQLDRMARGVRNFRRLELAGCGHSPHRDLPETVLAATVDFLDGRRIG
jgi:pimeloyl-ACP methyl ester carboxylesterase